jgi:DNA polymerase-1
MKLDHPRGVCFQA